MTDDLERRLRDRLQHAQLPSAPDSLHARVVDVASPPTTRTRPAFRGRWLLLPIAALLVIALGAGLLAVGGRPSQLSVTARSGDFQLTLSSAKHEYANGEQIDVSASVEYTGPNDSVQVYATYQSSKEPAILLGPFVGPLVYFSAEQLDGPISLPGIGGPTSCTAETLKRGEPVTQSVGNDLEYYPGHPLPAGTYRITADASFGSSCNHPIDLSASLVVQVSKYAASSSPTAAASSAPPIPSPTTNATLPRPISFAAGIALTVPAGWTVMDNDLALHYEHVLAYLGTGSGSTTCGSDYIPGAGGTCSEQMSIPVNGIEVKLSEWVGPPSPETRVEQVLGQDPLASPSTVAGMPAAVRDGGAFGSYGADRGIEWTISKPGDPLASFVITADLKGPDMSASLAALSQLISSVSFPGTPTGTPTPTPTPKFVTPGPTPWPSNACGGFHLKVVNEDTASVTVTINDSYTETVDGGTTQTIVEWLPPNKPLMPWSVVVTGADGTQIGSAFMTGPVDQKIIVSGGQMEYGPYDIRTDGCG